MVRIRIEFEIDGRRYALTQDTQFKDFIKIVAELMDSYPHRQRSIVKIVRAIVQLVDALTELEKKGEQ